MLTKLFGGLAISAALVGAGFTGSSPKAASEAPCCAKGSCCSEDCCKDCPDCACDGACCDLCVEGCECPNKA